MLFNRVKVLSEKRGKNIKEVAKELGFSENAFYKWKSQSPKAETIEKVADYFNVSVDYLLGRTDEEETPQPYYALTDKDERDIAKDLERMMEELNSGASMAFMGEPMSDEDRELLRISLENTLRMSKEMAKKKFTPKKYRK
ncbi:helix-turn-helix domain-containing protein [Paenibacillus woosongensis]|uniref:Transcriptional regulator n=1 Tax=Paenibacillus woosongensis TaxID=307580 RepID=A0ABQ4MPG2_9BACL|nr:helix-turn-helix transcriptional regulator [Paenibacillus woosongensis]GIP57872.1 transcriptional regulator [Paenibacillus woosongensis]